MLTFNSYQLGWFDVKIVDVDYVHMHKSDFLPSFPTKLVGLSICYLCTSGREWSLDDERFRRRWFSYR